MTDRSKLENYLTIRQAAEHLGVSYMLVHRRVTAGDIPSVQLSNRWLIHKDDLDPKLVEHRAPGRKQHFRFAGDSSEPRSSRLNLMVSENEDRWLRDIAKEQGLSVSDVMRQALSMTYGD